MVATIKRDIAIRKVLGYGNPGTWRHILPVVQELERAHPQLSQGGPHLEYPWEDSSTGKICWPEQNLQIALLFGDPKSKVGNHLLKFATQLSVNFDKIFPHRGSRVIAKSASMI